MACIKPLTLNISTIEDKAHALVTNAKYARTSYIQQYEKLMKDHLENHDKIKIFLLCYKRNRNNLPRLPSEIWNLILMEFGGDSRPLIYSFTISKQISTNSRHKMDQIWSLYHWYISQYDINIEKEKKSCDIIIQYIYDKLYNKQLLL